MIKRGGSGGQNLVLGKAKKQKDHKDWENNSQKQSKNYEQAFSTKTIVCHLSAIVCVTSGDVEDFEIGFGIVRMKMDCAQACERFLGG